MPWRSSSIANVASASLSRRSAATAAANAFPTISTMRRRVRPSLSSSAAARAAFSAASSAPAASAALQQCAQRYCQQVCSVVPQIATSTVQKQAHSQV